MAHLWIEDRASAGTWAVVPLTGERVALTGVRGAPVAPAVAASAVPLERSPALLAPASTDAADSCDRWVLLGDPLSRVCLNGLLLVTGIRVLRNKDEIQAGDGGPVYFSTERLPAVEVFAASVHSAKCPRCQQEIASGAAAVRCPACGIWHHQSEELPCWTGYVNEDRGFKTCALCDYIVSLYPDAEFQWTPEGM